MTPASHWPGCSPTPRRGIGTGNIAAAGRSGAEELVAPRLLAHECSYRLLKFGRSRRWGEVKIAEYGEVIDYFGIRYFDTTGRLAELIRFAVRHNVQGL